MITDRPTLALSDHLDPAVVAQLFDGLREFNAPFAGPANRQDLLVTARGSDGDLLGGLTGLTNWQWLYVDYLWVAEGARGSGLGSSLLCAAEEEAVRRGCRWSRLYTYDFQAPGFYAGHGYEQCAVLEDYPPGHRQIWFRKGL